MPNTNKTNSEIVNSNPSSKLSSENTKSTQKSIKINNIQLDLPTTSASNKKTNTKLISAPNKSKALTKHAFSDGQIVRKSNNTTKTGNPLHKLKTINNNGKKIKSTATRTDPESNENCKANNSADMTADVDLLSEQLSQTKLIEGSMFSAKWIVTPRDSLEKIARKAKQKPQAQESTDYMASTSIAAADNNDFSNSQAYSLEAELPHSETVLGSEKIENSYTKIFGWDPWDKINRKCKRDVKRKKYEKTPSHSRENSKSRPPNVDVRRKDHLAGGELKSALAKSEVTAEVAVPAEVYHQENFEIYKYFPQRKKSVEFTNEVMVIWYTGEEVVKETKEPLKKELEQQLRNKEMRMGHTQNVLFESKGKYKAEKDDYMAAWFKK